MGIFQKSVVKKYLNALEKKRLDSAYQTFKINFSLDKIEEIKLLKEEEYQDGFLRDLFVDVFGYTLKPDKNFNLAREFKNLDDGKKADGAILNGKGNAIAVIELKSTKTKDLKSITNQAFNYKHNQPDCNFVITSNFQKLRFYLNNATEFEEFDLFNITRKEFDRLFLILNKNSLFSDVPQKLKQESIFHEENVSKQLYKDYSIFKNNLFDNLIKNNPEKDKLTLFKKSQKLIDRFLFILFAEDCGLLPPNSIERIIQRFFVLKDEDAYKPLYDIYKQYFGYMNIGRKGKNSADDIPEYNGGLFYADTELDNLKIDDEVLIEDLRKLSTYDFNTDVDVNILGHIFEHSLSEIEEITAEIEGVNQDKTKSKRKKDGIFYTPKYITQYIVENTVGKLCEEKRIEFKIDEIEFDGSYKTKLGKLTTKGNKLYQKLKDYKDWLITLKILDPACGSGAFLNQALNFLIQEHKTIDDIIAELTNIPLRLFDTNKEILENNLYGVDINEESVEIAKLSLWLRTAQKGRKLSNLNDNIKCGNSLIDDPKVAGEKAFDWHKEFPQIFKTKTQKLKSKKATTKPDYLQLIKKHSKIVAEKAAQSAKLSTEAIKHSEKIYEYVEKQSYVNEPLGKYNIPEGGFDVIIGNPPYGVDFKKAEKKYLSGFDKLVPDYEIYIYFISLATDKLLKKNGILSYIFPNTFLSILYGEKYRRKIIDNFKLNEIVDLSNDKTFTDASVRTCILNLQNKEVNNYDVCFKKVGGGNKKLFVELNSQNKKNLIKNIDNWLNISTNTNVVNNIVEKIKDNKRINDFFEVSQGLIPYDKYRGHTQYQIKNRVYHKDYKFDETYKKELKGADIQQYNLKWNGKLWISYGNWLAAPRQSKFFLNPRILIREITGTFLYCSYTKEEFYNTPSLINIIDEKNVLSLKYLLAILNSKLLGWYHNTTSPKAKKGLFPKILINDVRNLPVKETLKEAQLPFIEKADKMLELNQQLQENKTRFLNRVKDNFELEKITKKLGTFYDFDFKVFVSELKKQKIKLSLVQQDEWEEYFSSYKSELNQLQTEIKTTDQTIDKMVYELYELTDEEIKIVEGE